MSALKTDISAEYPKDVDNCMEFKNVVFNAARDGKLQRLRIFLEHRTKDEVRILIHAKTNDATPLTMACRNGHLSVVEYLVEKRNADIEQVGSVTFDGEKIDGAPPLWCAAAAGFLDIVKYLIKMKARVNNTTFTNSTPLRAACFDGHFDIVQYLVDHNANIEVANRHGHTCLMIACYKSHYKIVKYLLDKGADVNRKSIKGNTALHDSAESGSLEIMKLLLLHHAKMEKDSYGMTPLLAAAVTGHTFIVEYLITRSETSRLEKIDALELLGATYVDKKRDMQGAIKFWKMAMEERYCDEQNVIAKPSTPSPISAYENAVEVRTLDGLCDVMADADVMRMQALLVRERILGPAHPDTSYYIRYRGAVYADLGNFDRCITLWMYALEMQQKMLEPLSPMTQSSLLSFAELFSFMMSDARHRRSYGMFFGDMMIVFTKSVLELESGMAQLSKVAASERDMGNFNRLMIIIMHLICLLCQTLPTMTAQQLHEFKMMTYKLVKINPRSSKGFTVMHLACSKDTSTVGRYPVCSFPSPEVVSLLIDVGAQVNATDNNHNTALHVASINRPCKAEVIRMLLDNGAHIDACNSDNKTPMQLMHNMTIYDIVSPLNFMTLQCLAARKIVQCNILYEGHIPSRLEEFVRMH